MTDGDSDEDDHSQCSELASQAMYVLPFYSLLSSDRQAKVCTSSRALLLWWFC